MSLNIIRRLLLMNIFIREMKAHRKSLIIWSIGMLFMIISGMGKYSSYSGSGQSVTELFDKMPKSLKAVLGFGGFDVTKASGFYGMLFLYLVIMVTIHAVMLGANIISKEERDKTTEFLMVKPVSRTRIITSKLLAALANIVVINIVTLFLSISIVGKYSKGEAIAGDIQILMVGMFILQLLFLFIGTAIASFSKNPKISNSIATTVLLVTFLISVVTDLNSNLEVLKYVTPFKYFVAEKIMYGGGLDPVFVILSFVIIAVMVYGTYVFYKKRDLKV
jgi:ABC-2 type transport system permease protein